MSLRIIIFLFCLSFLSTLNGQKSTVSELGIDLPAGSKLTGLKVGDKAPVFTAYDQKGKKTESAKLLEKGPLVIFFYRGKWSPDCNRFLSNCQDSAYLIINQGVNIVAITPESIENVEQTVLNNDISYTVLYDCEEKIMKDYNVLYDVTKEYYNKILKETSIDIASNNGREEARLPVTATYIISRDGTIAAAHFEPDYRKRASVKWILVNMGKVL